MEIKCALEIVAGVIMVAGVTGLFVERTWRKRGIGVRVIQLLTVILVLPIILILSLEGILKGETVATLLGAVIGYILSGIGKDESHKKTNDDQEA